MEKIDMKIVKVLTEICPCFSFEPPHTATWHGTGCAVNNGPCVCVWHLKSECFGGKWEELGFVDEYNKKLADKKEVALNRIQHRKARPLRRRKGVVLCQNARRYL